MEGGSRPWEHAQPFPCRAGERTEGQSRWALCRIKPSRSRRQGPGSDKLPAVWDLKARPSPHKALLCNLLKDPRPSQRWQLAAGDASIGATTLPSLGHGLCWQVQGWALPPPERTTEIPAGDTARVQQGRCWRRLPLLLTREGAGGTAGSGRGLVLLWGLQSHKQLQGRAMLQVGGLAPQAAARAPLPASL